MLTYYTSSSNVIPRHAPSSSPTLYRQPLSGSLLRLSSTATIYMSYSRQLLYFDIIVLDIIVFDRWNEITARKKCFINAKPCKFNSSENKFRKFTVSIVFCVNHILYFRDVLLFRNFFFPFFFNCRLVKVSKLNFSSVFPN